MRESTSIKPFCVKIDQGVWPPGCLEKKKLRNPIGREVAVNTVLRYRVHCDYEWVSSFTHLPHWLNEVSLFSCLSWAVNTHYQSVLWWLPRNVRLLCRVSHSTQETNISRQSLQYWLVVGTDSSRQTREKRYILQKKCLKKWTGRHSPVGPTTVGLQLSNAYTDPEHHNAQRYRQTDRQTDRRQHHANNRSYCYLTDSLCDPALSLNMLRRQLKTFM